jgi:hypothetical protein
MQQPVGAPERREAPSSRPDVLPVSPAVGCLLAVAAGLLCAGAFALALRLQQRGEIAVSPQPFRAVRVWVLREAAGSGLGLSTTWPEPGATSDRVCATTAVRFLFTRPAAEPADTEFCECFARVGEGWAEAGSCPE